MPSHHMTSHDITSHDKQNKTHPDVISPGLLDLMCSLDRMTIHIGFCIEAKEEAEMPEVLFGCVQLNNPTVDKHPKWDHSK